MISAVVLAAGQSQRMGQPKINLPWGETTVLGQILSVLHAVQVDEIVVVTGGIRPEAQPGWQDFPLVMVPNPRYRQSEMLDSFQIGLRRVHPQAEALLMVLGDQPQIQPGVVRSLLAAYARDKPALLVPSYQMRRGHPWLLRRGLIEAVLGLSGPATLRDFLHQYAAQTVYLSVDTESVLQDLDTPQDYARYNPGGG